MWMKEKAIIMKKLGFQRSKTDPCLYIKHLKTGESMYVLVYVDDCIIVGPSIENDIFVNLMERVLKIKKLGELRHYNGNDYEIDATREQIKMSQKKLIESMVKEIKIKTTKIPGYPNKVLQKQAEENPVMLNKYRRLVGKLLYVCNKSRPDVAYQCRELSQYMANPSKEHWELLIKTVSYLYHTIDKGLTLKADGDKETVIEAFVDSDYAGDPDDRRSITGFVILLNGMTISCK